MAKLPGLPKLPTLRSIIKAPPKIKPAPLGEPSPPPVLEPRRTFQRRFLIRRRGPQQTDVGEPYQETRAARDVDWYLPERIVLKSLRARRLLFEFSSRDRQPVSLAGYQVDFLVQSFTPPLALDVLDWQDQLVYPNRDAVKAAYIEASGFRYAHLWANDVLESQERLDYLLGSLLGQPAEVESQLGDSSGRFQSALPVASVPLTSVLGDDVLLDDSTQVQDL